MALCVSTRARTNGASARGATRRVPPHKARRLPPRDRGRDRHPRGACPSHDCPSHAIVAAVGLDEGTVARWMGRGRGGRAVQEYLVEQPCALRQVQTDELRTKKPRNKEASCGGL